MEKENVPTLRDTFEKFLEKLKKEYLPQSENTEKGKVWKK
jgi:hypothetical protein